VWARKVNQHFMCPARAGLINVNRIPTVMTSVKTCAMTCANYSL